MKAERPKRSSNAGRLVRPVRTFETYADAHPEVNLEIGDMNEGNLEDMMDELDDDVKDKDVRDKMDRDNADDEGQKD